MAIKRIFVAIDISEDVRREIADHISRLKKVYPHTMVKWEPIEKFHLTMKFFGDTDELQLARINDQVARAAASVSPFKLVARGPGSFRRRESAVLWIGVEESPGQVGRLSQIAHILEGGGRELRRFHPHITIARIKKPAQARELIDAHNRSDLDAHEFLVDHLTIYESKLLPSGSVYSVISRQAL